MPDNPFDTHERGVVRARKTPYVRFDLNDYSIPHQYVQKTLSVHASLETVRIVDGDECIAEHPRCFGKGEQIEQEAHINALWLSKTEARLHRGQDRLTQVSDHVPELLQQAVERGHVLKTVVRLLNEYLDHYGRDELAYAIAEALERQSPYPQAVAQILERRREDQHRPPPLSIAVPDKVKYLGIKPVQVADYDTLYSEADHE